jgi:hypothetical protein
MNIIEFRQEKIQEIESRAINEQMYAQIAFLYYFRDVLIDAGQVSDLLECHFDREKGDRQFKSMHVDAYNFEVSDNTFTLFYNDYSAGEIDNLNTEKVNLYATRLTNFFENVLKRYFACYEKSSVIYGVANEILKNIKTIDRIHLFIASTNKLSQRIKMKDFEDILVDGRHIKIDISVYDINDLYNFEMQSRPKETIEIDISDYLSNGIPCIKADIGVEKYSAYLAIIPGEFLCEIYRKFGGRLLESNVRSFLNVKGTVNKGIQNTILHEGEKFFTYNNGIACTEDGIILDENENHIMKIINYQIINGGQTTACLASAKIKFGEEANLKKIFVPMKLTVLSEPDEELVSDISKYANSQNKVSNSDLNSNKKFYVRLEEFSRKLWAPKASGCTYQTRWFFERSRGQYDRDQMDMTKSNRDNFKLLNPKAQLIKKTDVAKFYNSYMLKPYNVAWGAEINARKFQDTIDTLWAKDNTQFNEIFFKNIVAMGILFNTTRLITSQTEWYKANSGILAQITPYVVSKLIYEISKLNDKQIDLKKIWESQEIAVPLKIEIEKLGGFVFNIVSDPHRQYINIAEWCKREACWESVKDSNYKLSNQSIEILVSKKDIVEEEIAAKKEQKATNKTLYSLEIFYNGAKYWEGIISQSIRDGVISDRELSFLNSAKNSCITMKLVSDSQAKVIKGIVDRLQSIGIDVKKY